MHITASFVASSVLAVASAQYAYNADAGSSKSPSMYISMTESLPAGTAASETMTSSMPATETMMSSMPATETMMSSSMASTDTMMSSMAGSETMTSSDMSSTSMSAPQASTTVQVVKVSDKKGTLVFSPANLTAAVGDMIQFQFYPRNHSVVQSTFDQPCQPRGLNQPSMPGFFSGFMPVSNTSTTMPVWTIAINDTKPIWFYCSQGKHCQAGMVGVINAPAANASRTLETYRLLAAQAAANLSPGEVEGGAASTSTIGSSDTASATATSTMATGTNAAGSATGSTPARATTNGVGSDRLTGARQLLGASAAAGLVALCAALLM
ncbi:MAG: hypothetical protein M1826_007753 [Phylliscum demangeonii]|nr:MAG: hypothetical protein M1826_007753 [Phylliscum demangeonii]